MAFILFFFVYHRYQTFPSEHPHERIRGPRAGPPVRLLIMEMLKEKKRKEKKKKKGRNSARFMKTSTDDCAATVDWPRLQQSSAPLRCNIRKKKKGKKDKRIRRISRRQTDAEFATQHRHFSVRLISFSPPLRRREFGWEITGVDALMGLATIRDAAPLSVIIRRRDGLTDGRCSNPSLLL